MRKDKANIYVLGPEKLFQKKWKRAEQIRESNAY